MNISVKRKKLVNELKNNLKRLEQSLSALLYSWEKCSKIGLEKGNHEQEEQEAFEALTSRFARTSDILTQKVARTIFTLLQEDIKTFIDAANFLEKLDIVQNADDILTIRELRNQIAHEYVEDSLTDLFRDILKYTPMLRNIIESIKEYSQREW